MSDLLSYDALKMSSYLLLRLDCLRDVLIITIDTVNSMQEICSGIIIILWLGVWVHHYEIDRVFRALF